MKAFADNRAHQGVDVDKVWWGFPPDASFASRIPDPERLDGVERLHSRLLSVTDSG